MGDKRPPRRREPARDPVAVGEKTRNPNATPVFCFHHIHRELDVDNLSTEQQAALARTLQQRCSRTWTQINLSSRGGQGTEFIAKNAIRPGVPEKFQDQSKFLAMRYDGQMPMIGIRVDDTFHVLWIERAFGDVYDHG